MLAGVIFDLDGVLVDSHPLHRQVWRELLLSAGRKVSETELDFVLEGAKQEEILRHFLGDISPAEMERYRQKKSELFEKEEARLKILRGVRAVLRALDQAAIPKAVATGASRHRALRILHRFRLIDRFAAVITGDDVPRGKEDPAIFLEAARQLQAPPTNLLVIEDSVPGIKTAKSMGMRCVALAKGPRARAVNEAGADHVAEDLSGLRVRDLQRLFENGRR